MHQLLQLKKTENGVRFTNSAQLGRFHSIINNQMDSSFISNGPTKCIIINIQAIVRQILHLLFVHAVIIKMFIR
jgi:hypothetical protein